MRVRSLVQVGQTLLEALRIEATRTSRGHPGPHDTSLMPSASQVNARTRPSPGRGLLPTPLEAMSPRPDGLDRHAGGDVDGDGDVELAPPARLDDGRGDAGGWWASGTGPGLVSGGTSRPPGRRRAPTAPAAGCLPSPAMPARARGAAVEDDLAGPKPHRRPRRRRAGRGENPLGVRAGAGV